MGAPHRLKYLRRIFDVIRKKRDVKFWTGAEIADWYRADGRKHHDRYRGPAAQKSDHAADVRSRLMLVTLCLIWGMTWPMMKISLTEIPPLSMRTMTAAIGGVALFAICLFKRRSLRVSTARDWGHIFVASFFNISAFSLFTAFAQIQAATSRVAILTYTVPIWTPVVPGCCSANGRADCNILDRLVLHRYRDPGRAVGNERYSARPWRWPSAAVLAGLPAPST